MLHFKFQEKATRKKKLKIIISIFRPGNFQLAGHQTRERTCLPVDLFLSPRPSPRRSVVRSVRRSLTPLPLSLSGPLSHSLSVPLSVVLSLPTSVVFLTSPDNTLKHFAERLTSSVRQTLGADWSERAPSADRFQRVVYKGGVIHS